MVLVLVLVLVMVLVLVLVMVMVLVLVLVLVMVMVLWRSLWLWLAGSLARTHGGRGSENATHAHALSTDYARDERGSGRRETRGSGPVFALGPYTVGVRCAVCGAWCVVRGAWCVCVCVCVR